MDQDYPIDMTQEEGCEMCIPPNRYSLAMAYVQDQMFEDLYEADVGWNRGTIFQQLDLPFLCGMGGGGQ